jgi:hypothetical protein
LVVNRHGREEPGEQAKAAGQAVRHLQVGCLGGVSEGQGQQGRGRVDEQSIAAFERDLKGNLFKLWNRLSSGSYFPPPVKAVEIPKSGGRGVRILGVPTVADRIAQTVVRLYLEPKVEPSSTRLLRVSSGGIGTGRGGGMPTALLEGRLGH